MIKFERTSVMNFENAMRGARNPLNSWGRMDSSYDEDGNFVFGPNDLDLAKRLRMAGSDHRKFIRQIFDVLILIGSLIFLASATFVFPAFFGFRYGQATKVVFVLSAIRLPNAKECYS